MEIINMNSKIGFGKTRTNKDSKSDEDDCDGVSDGVDCDQVEE